MLAYLWIGLGSALGGMARYGLSNAVAASLGEDFPWGTVIVNITGSFVIGFAAAIAAPDGRPLLNTTGRVFVMTGLCGGYTTFSAFSIQTLTLAQSGQWAAAGANVGISVVACLAAVWLGYMAATAFNALLVKP